MAAEVDKAASTAFAQAAKGGGRAGKSAQGGLRLFISYSRKNIDVVSAIAADLAASGFEVKIDTEAIEYGEQWLAQLDHLILNCDTVVFFTAFESIKSKICDWELEKADTYGKRVFPVMIEAVPPGQLPARLSKHQLFPSRKPSDGPEMAVYDRAAHLSVLVDALHKDVPWLMEGTRLADRAHQWIERGRSNGLLLSAAALKDADGWLSRRPPKGPAASREVLGFIDASRKRASQRQRWIVSGSLAAVVVASTLAIFAALQRQEAITQRDETASGRSKALAELAFRAIESGDAATGLLLALSGVPDAEEGKGRRDHVETENMLLSGILNLHEKRTVDGQEIAALSGDQTLFAFAKEKTNIQLVDVATGRDLVALKQGSEVTKIRFSPDGKRLLSEGESALHIWNLDTSRLLATLKNTAGFGSAGFSADGTRLLLSNGTTKDESTHGVMVWNIQKLQRDLLLSHPADVTLAVFSPDEKWIATAARDEKVRIFDAKSGRLQTTVSVKAEHLAFTSNGLQFVTFVRTGGTGEVRFWGIAKGEMARTVEVALSNDKTVNDNLTDLSPDGTRVVINDRGENTVKAWSLTEKDRPNEILNVKAQLAVLTRAVAYGGVDVSFDRSGEGVVSSHLDDTVRVWDLRPYPARTFSSGCTASHMLTSPDGSLLITTCEKGGTISVWNANTGTLMRKFGRADGENANLVLSPDAGQLIALGSDGTAVVWSIKEGTKAATLDHGAELVSGAIDSSGTRLATGAKDGTIKIWRRSSPGSADWGTTPIALSADGFSIARLVFAPSGDRLLSLSGDRTGRIWDAGSGKLLTTLAAPHVGATDFNAAVYMDDEATGSFKSDRAACAFSPDGRYAATEKNGVTYLWDAASGAQLSAVRTTHSTPIMMLAFSTDGKRLISAGDTWKTWVGEVPSGQTFRYLDTASNDEAAYHAGSELLATEDLVLGVLLSDPLTGRKIASFPGDYFHVLLSGDGSHLFANKFDNSNEISIWTLPRPGAERVRLARQLVPRCLTTLQLRDAGLDPAPPRWCITGPDHVTERDPAKWDGKWPYRTPEWRAWQAARDRGENPKPPNDARGGPPPPEPNDADTGTKAQR